MKNFGILFVGNMVFFPSSGFVRPFQILQNLIKLKMSKIFLSDFGCVKVEVLPIQMGSLYGILW